MLDANLSSCRELVVSTKVLKKGIAMSLSWSLSSHIVGGEVWVR